MKIRKTGPWAAVSDLLGKFSPGLVAGLDFAAKEEAKYAEKMMKRAITSGGKSNKSAWPKLSPWTSLDKGHGRKLRDRKYLHAAIKAKRVTKGTWAVGISPSMTYPDGTAVHIVAKVHEEGATILLQMTKRMAAYLALRAKELGISDKKGGKMPVGSRFLVKIPRRSFIKDTEIAHFGRMARTKRLALYALQGIGVIKSWKALSKKKK